MKILHTEASEGWGGQEIRILREAEGMRSRGHEIIFAVAPGAILGKKAREKQFPVYEISFQRRNWISALFLLRRVIKSHSIDLINTHSSLDAWIGGLAARASKCAVIRTRHLSTNIKGGINGLVLYNWLADYVVTTCEEVVETIRKKARLDEERCLSIPTGVDPAYIAIANGEARAFREQYNIAHDEILVGTTCVLRSWKGISDMLKAAKELSDLPKLRWVVVGSGPSEERYRREHQELGLEDNFLFTGHLDKPFAAMSAMDIFLLLSTANEGVSQAALQAAYFQKPLVMTPTGGLKEVCIDALTGYLVDPHSPSKVAESVRELYHHPERRKNFGMNARYLVEGKFTFDQMLTQMETVYRKLK